MLPSEVDAGSTPKPLTGQGRGAAADADISPAGARDGAADGGAEARDGGCAAVCPPEMAHIGRYCIDRWEAHLVVRGPQGEEVVHPHFERPTGGVRYEARSAPGVFPQGYVSRDEAQSACQYAGKRLCNWIEWRRACQGKRSWRFPYGFSELPERCNSGKPHLLPELFDAGATGWSYEDHFNSPLLNQQPGYLAKTGAYERCTNDEGIYDMVGNLHEWVSTNVTQSFIDKLDSEQVERNEQPFRLGNGAFLGGFYSTRNEHGPGCTYITVAHEPSYHDYSTGFRCCRTAPRAKAKHAPGPRRPPDR